MLEHRGMVTGTLEEVERLNQGVLASQRTRYFDGYVPVPYVFPRVREQCVGDYATVEGQREWKRLALTIHPHFKLSHRVEPIWNVVAQKSGGYDMGGHNAAAFLQDLSLSKWGLTCHVYCSMYGLARGTMGSEGVTLDIEGCAVAGGDGIAIKNRYRLLQSMIKDLDCPKGCTARQAIYATFGGLPSFGDHAYGHLLGVAGIVYTHDGYFVFVRRSSKTASVNLGINVTASGGVDFEAKEMNRLGFPLYLTTELVREAQEELGVEGKDMVLHPVGFVRELPRGGSPEFLFLIEYNGNLEQLVSALHNNHNPHVDVDRLVFAFSRKTISSLIRDKEAGAILHHKALITLIQIDRYCLHTEYSLS